MNVWLYILSFFSVYTLCLSIFLFFKKQGNRYANKLFAFLLILFSYNFFFDVLAISKLNIYLTAALSLTTYIPMALYGPIYFFYMKSVSSDIKIGAKDIYHFLPVMIVLVVFMPYFILPQDEKILIHSTDRIEDYTLLVPYLDCFIIGLMIAYCAIIYHKFILGTVYNTTIKNWFIVLNLLFFLFALTWGIFYFLYFNKILQPEFYYVTFICMAIFVIFSSYYIIIQPSDFNGKVDIDRFFSKQKYCNSGLSEITAKALRDKLEKLMEEQKLYLNAELKLDELSKKLGLSRHNTSQIINEQFEMNFSEFVNYYRIKSAEDLILKRKTNNLTIEDIAEHSGFNNKTTFYKAFKKIHGTTPVSFESNILLEQD